MTHFLKNRSVRLQRLFKEPMKSGLCLDRYESTYFVWKLVKFLTVLMLNNREREIG